MVDLGDKGSDCEDMGSKTSALSDGTSNQLKTCVDCGTSKTPLWRGGPAGPKSLCNACGIRSRKKRRALLGVNKDDKKSKKIIEMTANHKEENEIEDKLKRKLVGLGKEVVLQRPRITSVFKRRRKLGEEEQAAMLLMALFFYKNALLFF